MKSIDHTWLMRVGTLKASGLFRLMRAWVWSAGSIPICDRSDRPVCDSSQSLAHYADRGNTTQSPSVYEWWSALTANPWWPRFRHPVSFDSGSSAFSRSSAYTFSRRRFFVFQLFEPFYQGRIHATKLGSPLIELRGTNAMFRHGSGTDTPFSFCFRIARIWLSEYRDDHMV